MRDIELNIVFLDRATIDLADIDFSAVEKCGTLACFENSITESEIIERSQTADVIITNKARITRRVIENCKNLKLVTVIATGYNNVDIEALQDHKIALCNVAGYAKNTVPQHTFAFILNLATKAYQYHADVISGEWQKSSSFTLLKYPTFELNDKTLGIIGFGVIGKAVAQIAAGFGMKIIFYDPGMCGDKTYSSADLRTLLQNSDIVTIHCPLTEKTRGLIGKNELALMKSSALIINTARGGIVDEAALAQALNNGTIAGAGVDVLSEEPPQKGNALLGAKNCMITPHSAWSTRESRQTLINETARNIEAFRMGKNRNRVNA